MNSAVLLLAYGGPNSLADIPMFLRDVRGGQPVSQTLIDETTRRYNLIGGGSPLLDITRRLAGKLQMEVQLPVYVGMRHWHPYIANTVQEMVRDQIHHPVVIALAPHFSPLSIGAYRAKLDQALQGSEMSIDFVESWHTEPHYLDGIAQNVRAAQARLGEAKIIFTAHSLPVPAREPYESQLRETARLIAHELGLRENRWMLGYQSAARAASAPWLEPQIEKLVPELAAEGERNLVVAPIGFLADHLEVLYDLDIALQDTARANGVRLVRTPMLNDSDALVNSLADLVRERIKEKA